jgi:hypothetical protein
MLNEHHIPDQIFENLPQLDKNQTLKNFYKRTFANLSFSNFVDDPYSLLLLPLTEGDSLNHQSEIDRKCELIGKSPLSEALIKNFQSFINASNVTNGMKKFTIWEFEDNLFYLSFLSGKSIGLPVWLDRQDCGIYSREKKILEKIEEQNYHDLLDEVVMQSVEENTLPICVEEFIREKFQYTSEKIIIGTMCANWKKDFARTYGREP